MTTTRTIPVLPMLQVRSMSAHVTFHGLAEFRTEAPDERRLSVGRAATSAL